jgi:hypothetical protein
LLIIAALCGVASSDRQTYAFANTGDITRTTVAGATLRSTVLRLYDQDYELAAKPIADHGTPIVINNAGFQGNRFAEKFTAAGARAYLGPLFPAPPAVAQEVIVKLLGKYFGMPLPAALWSAQREIFNGTPHPYIAIGVYPQKLRASDHDIPKYIATRFARALRRWKAALEQLDSRDEQRSRIYQEIIAFYKHELAAIKKRWLSTAGTGKR